MWSKTRSWAGKAVVVAAAGTLLPLAVTTAALANAPNPNPDIKAAGTVNGNGTVTVKLTGTWSWPGQTCEGRYGEGWAVDWWGISSSQLPANNFTLTNATVVNPPDGTISTASINAAGGIPIKGDGFFHVSSLYNGQTTNTSSTCTDTTINGQQGSTGSWTATATYPNKGDIPPAICVNGYDEHGSEGKPSNSANDFSATNDNDNSIQTNAFNPAAGQGYCTTPVIKPPPKPKITLNKEICNVAATKCSKSMNSQWVKKHEIPKGSTAVWRLTITNTGNTTLSNLTVTDALAPACAGPTSPSTLAKGGVIVIQCSTGNVTKGFTNVAKVTGAPPSGASVSASSSAAVSVIKKPPPPKLITSQTLTPNDEAFIGQEATGSVTFSLYPPDNMDCSGTPAFTQTVTVASSGTAETTNTSFVATEKGEWRWLVTYSGNDGTLTSPCGAENFTIVNG